MAELKDRTEFDEVLQRLDTFCPNKQYLNQTELSRFLGVSDRFIRKHWKPYQNKLAGGYPKTKIAYVLTH